MNEDSPNPIEFRFNESGALIGAKYPRFAFRYAKWNTPLVDSLMRRSLWFSHPTSFNDALDCQNVFDAEVTKSELAQYLSLYLPPSSPHLDPDAIASEAIKKPELLRGLLNATYEIKISEVHVCCFSVANNVPLLWSHYADGHRGICLVFDIHQMNSDGRFAMTSVTYSDEAPTWNQIRERIRYSNTDLFQQRFQSALLATKLKEWNYEQEIRFISHTAGLNEFPSNAFAGIILGARCDTGLSRECERVAASVNPESVVTRANLDSRSGGVMVEGFKQQYISANVVKMKLLNPNPQIGKGSA